MKFSKYYFENFPADTPFDWKNPRYVLSLDGVDSILERIAVNRPYSLAVEDFDDSKLVNALLDIEVLRQKNGRLGIGVPFFLEKDAQILKELSKQPAGRIAEVLISNRKHILEIAKQIDNGFPVERNLYHILCGHIFDGLLFDYLEENELVTTSCVHTSGLDYLVILYEDANALNTYSDLLLCSYNRLTVSGKGFVSFGDSNGTRKDLYRYMRLRELNRLSAQERAYTNYPAEDLIENFIKLADGLPVDDAYLEVYGYFDYCKNGEIVVPIYDARAYEVADQLYTFVLGIIREHLTNALASIRNESRLLAFSHEVKAKDIANEIYHLIFGEVNEFLTQSGLVAGPPYAQGEGRYFKSFER